MNYFFRKRIVPAAVVILLLVLSVGSCKMGGKWAGRTPDPHLQGALNHRSNLPFDSSLMTVFFKAYPLLNRYEADVREVYRQHNYTEIWFDSKGVIEFGQTLFTKLKELDQEGISATFPYQDKLEGVFENEKENTLSDVETDLMLTNLYLFYTAKVIKGLDDTTTTAIEWLLPRKEVAMTALLDSMMNDPQLLERSDSMLLGQYYRLRDVLKKYREIEQNGGWKPVEMDAKSKGFKPGDTGRVIRQVRERLFITGEITSDNGGNRYDPELVEAVKKFQQHNGFNVTDRLLPEHVAAMNVPVGERIKTLMVNMERCRWISPEFARAREYIVVNIPAFRLTYIKDGKIVLFSPVIVGKNVTKTVIFSGMLSYIVFSPYWNVPTSILNKEIKPGIARDPHYLEKHNMEWFGGQVRQKPGKNNSLGLVKFIFPNSNDIYMHDTPAKSLFGQENRAFSHGCIRLGKPRDLAIAILQDDPDWSPAKIDRAMNAGVENTVRLKNKIPVYIGYMTAWVDTAGTVSFYRDVYGRDGRLWGLLTGEERTSE